MKRLLFAALLLFPAMAHANPFLDPRVCRDLLAEYTPGVDVKGKPVAPADLDAAMIAMPEKFSFDVSVEVAQAVGVPVPQGSQTLTSVGTITFDKGILTFNGQPLTVENEANLKALCVPEPVKNTVH